MLKLFTFAPGFGEISASPFSVKAICLLEMSGQAYTLNQKGDPRKAPKKKLPVLEHDGKIISDSDDIRDYLEMQFNVDFDAGLNAEQRAVSRSIIRMAEEHIYFAIVSTRWQRDENWAIIREEFFGMIPRLVRKFVTNKIRKGAVTMVYGQGMGRHSEAEQAARVSKDLAAIAALLADKPFLFGDKPTAADASVVAILNNITCFPRPTLLNEAVQKLPTLVAYAERGKQVMYPK